MTRGDNVVLQLSIQLGISIQGYKDLWISMYYIYAL